MKSKGLILLLAGGLLALAVWQVQRNGNEADVRLDPIAQGGERTDDEIPEKFRTYIDKGLEYLIKHQHKDGHWEGDGGKHPVAMTGLVGLALVMKNARWGRARSISVNVHHAANINKAADWLMEKSKARRDGLIFSEHASETTRYMEGHGLATLFLAGAYRDEQDKARRENYADVLTRAVKYIVKAQSSQGGWYHTSKVEGHDFDAIATTAIQIQALQAASHAGISVPNDVLQDAKMHLKTQLGQPEKSRLDLNGSQLADTAAVLACRNTIYVRGNTDTWWLQWLKNCESAIPTGRNINLGRDAPIHYYYSQAAFGSGEKSWKNYHSSMFDHVCDGQHKDGSWPPSDGISVGPVYATAVWCVVLQLAKNRHPALQEIQVAID